MGTAIKHPEPDRVKQSFVIFDIRALWRSVGVSVNAIQFGFEVTSICTKLSGKQISKQLSPIYYNKSRSNSQRKLKAATAVMSSILPGDNFCCNILDGQLFNAMSKYVN